MIRRVFVIVLDSFGIGWEPDADLFGDVGANTLASVSRSAKLSVPHMCALGLSDIDGVDCLPPVAQPTGAYGRMRERSMGKDTTVGHWELAGVISQRPFPTYPHGFPAEVINAFRQATGREVLCNLPYSGTKVIEDYGEEHLRTGALIVYTSADSVFQIAAHESLVPPEELYRICRAVRTLLTGEHAVGRVIARPFIGEPGHFTRTANRRDFSLPPTGRTMADAISEAGLDVIGVGKIEDIFAGRGITRSFHTHGNTHGMEVTSGLADEDFHGLCFVNLVDFDMLYGHRQDVDGYAAALTEFDCWLPGFQAKLREGDLLVITADHGCDPADNSTDHTREYVPLLVGGQGVRPVNLGTRSSFADLSVTICDLLGVPFAPPVGTSFRKELGL